MFRKYHSSFSFLLKSRLLIMFAIREEVYATVDGISFILILRFSRLAQEAIIIIANNIINLIVYVTDHDQQLSSLAMVQSK